MYPEKIRRIQPRPREPCEVCRPDRILSLQKARCRNSDRCVGAPGSWIYPSSGPNLSQKQHHARERFPNSERKAKTIFSARDRVISEWTLRRPNLFCSVSVAQIKNAQSQIGGKPTTLTLNSAEWATPPLAFEPAKQLRAPSSGRRAGYTQQNQDPGICGPKKTLVIKVPL